jgi:demethylmenaquinone methyltransferase / 2-methoxy-6-polyprenyl-1,4-benzoquinol methylase
MSAATQASGETMPEQQVEAMFDRVARYYDLINSVMSAGLHHTWRVRAADFAEIGLGDRVLDVAAGTGDLTIELSKRVGPDGEVVGIDLSEAMLELAREKAPGIRFDQGSALDLPYADGEFAAATTGFAARNFSDLRRGLTEMRRVVRPGGRVVVLDFTTPTRPPLSWFFQLWFNRVVPMLGRFSNDPDAYNYLPNSVKRFPPPDRLAAELADIGLSDVRWMVTAGGIVTVHAGVVPAD